MIGPPVHLLLDLMYFSSGPRSPLQPSLGMRGIALLRIILTRSRLPCHLLVLPAALRLLIVSVAVLVACALLRDGGLGLRLCRIYRLR